MTLLYSLYIESTTIPIPDDIAIQICNLIQKYYNENLCISGKFGCQFCDGNGFKDGKNNRGCSIINQIYHKLKKNTF
ncbi:MAG: hypothetical protein ACFE9Z_08335 [Promethearchaeota archaeon]